MSRVMSVVALLFVPLLSACAIGNRYDYASAQVYVPTKSHLSVAVGVHDQRQYIVYGTKKPDFVGLQRGGYGNPFDVRTASKQPLSDDVANAVVAGLKNAGFDTECVKTIASESFDKVRSDLLSLKKDKALLITIKQWRTDTYVNVRLEYELAAAVFDVHGNLIARGEVRGDEHLGGSFLNPPSHATRAAPIALARKVELLLGSDDIKKAMFTDTDENK